MICVTMTWRFLRGIKLTYWILFSMVVGIIIGISAPKFALHLKPFADVFLRMIKLLMVPLVFSTLVVGVAKHGSSLKQIGRLAIKGLLYFDTVMTIAMFIGLGMVHLIKPGAGVDLSVVKKDIKEEKPKNSGAWSESIFSR